ncbi:hypothetical protein DICPUDRAFT_93461 [Dictyostelium purpureum]|uniref:SMP-LTD domain-containing protein n=1 Tax=Dictyostelium purpureum TaxID=5786 RepID=F0Z7P7_DICPU|nr:uncharacterized protein DICPUDRAFT_93461 [Dictyostelium purpureum]EGC40051.1 hypothetical protein DICPUDRAFT_93461 [Dictyostelium purpureum]|eukprot:XP_003283400.1 hypothetical protein DICPUDRAFT_93461 [Dictyostelium purpureum]
MSFKLSWGGFDDAFYNNLKSELNKTLNSGPPIPNITDKLLVYQIHLGDIAPEIQLLELDPSKDRMKFVFKVKYNGNGLLELRTMVQANPIYLGSSVTNVPRFERDLIKKLRFGSASNPHIIPLSILIKDIVFDGILSVCIVNNNNSNGNSNETMGNNSPTSNGGKIEASFKEDPLKNVNIVTSFDEFPAAGKFIASLVENQLRDFINKEFPSIVGAITIPSTGGSETAQSSNSPNTVLVDLNNKENGGSPIIISSANTTPSSSPQLDMLNSNHVNSSPLLESPNINIPPIPVSPLENNQINNKFTEKTTTNYNKKMGYIE